MGVIRRRSIDEIFVKVQKKLKQEKSKVRLLDSIIKKTLNGKLFHMITNILNEKRR